MSEDGAWVEEFDGYTPSVQIGRSDGPPPQKKEASAMEELEQEMQLLQWHKLANEAALKAALLRTKKLKSDDKRPAPTEDDLDRAEWMKQIIEEEQNKPLQVNEDFVNKYEEDEERTGKALENEVLRHIFCLKKLQARVKEREVVKNRNAVYRERKKQLEAMRSGPAAPGTQPASERGLDDVDRSEEVLRASEEKKYGRLPGTLSTVIGSLDKLVELERRISRLETVGMRNNGNNYSNYNRNVGPVSVSGSSSTRRVPTTAVASRTLMRFTKRRTEATSTTPAKTYFSVKVKAGNWRLPRIPVKANPSRGAGTGGGGGLRSVSERFSVVGGSGVAGARGLRGANAGARIVGSTRAQRQDAVVKEWLVEKQKRVESKRRALQTTLASRSTRETDRTGSTVARNHLQQFHELRRQFEAKKDALLHDLMPKDRKLRPGVGRGVLPANSAGVNRAEAWRVASEVGGNEFGSRLPPLVRGTRGSVAVRGGSVMAIDGFRDGTGNVDKKNSHLGRGVGMAMAKRAWD